MVVVVYVCSTKSWKSWNFQISEIRLEGVEACAGLHIRSGCAPGCPGASAKHSAVSQHVIPPDHRHLCCVVSYIPYIQWKSMKINEKQWKSMKFIKISSGTMILACWKSWKNIPDRKKSINRFFIFKWLTFCILSFPSLESLNPSKNT